MYRANVLLRLNQLEEAYIESILRRKPASGETVENGRNARANNIARK